jgi:hypothetical protein
MNKRPIRFVLLLATVLSSAAFLLAQTPQHPASGSTKSTKSRGASDAKDENIKQDSQPNDPNVKTEAPPDKGGPKTRGASCRIHIDNRTGYYVNIYTDGQYRGQVSPYGDSIGYVGCGDTNFYARAVFNDGSVLTWGPSGYFVDGSFTWTLH